MQVGDKRQAGMLGVAAVGAIGFLIFQLVPKADAHAPAPQAVATIAAIPASAPPPVAPIAAKASDVTLERDPFAVAPRVHPRPSVASVSSPVDEKEAVPAEPPRGSGLLPMTAPVLAPATFGSTDAVPPVTALPSPDPVQVPRKSLPTKSLAKASSGSEGSKNDSARKEIPVALLGIVEMPVPVAMVRVGTSERTLHVGDEIVPGLRIAGITLAGITFVNRPGRTLVPGEETLL